MLTRPLQPAFRPWEVKTEKYNAWSMKEIDMRTGECKERGVVRKRLQYYITLPFCVRQVDPWWGKPADLEAAGLSTTDLLTNKSHSSSLQLANSQPDASPSEIPSNRSGSPRLHQEQLPLVASGITSPLRSPSKGAVAEAMSLGVGLLSQVQRTTGARISVPKE